jgi:hypothetical protein
MPNLRRQVGRPRPQRNLPPANPSGLVPIAPTILPSTFVTAQPPPKLPLRPLRGHPLGTVLTIPTYGPLPPVPTVRPTIIIPPPVAPRRPGPPVIARPSPFILGMPPAGGPPRRMLRRR